MRHGRERRNREHAACSCARLRVSAVVVVRPGGPVRCGRLPASALRRKHASALRRARSALARSDEHAWVVSTGSRWPVCRRRASTSSGMKRYRHPPRRFHEVDVADRARGFIQGHRRTGPPRPHRAVVRANCCQTVQLSACPPSSSASAARLRSIPGREAPDERHVRSDRRTTEGRSRQKPSTGPRRCVERGWPREGRRGPGTGPGVKVSIEDRDGANGPTEVTRRLTSQKPALLRPRRRRRRVFALAQVADGPSTHGSTEARRERVLRPRSSACAAARAQFGRSWASVGSGAPRVMWIRRYRRRSSADRENRPSSSACSRGRTASAGAARILGPETRFQGAPGMWSDGVAAERDEAGHLIRGLNARSARGLRPARCAPAPRTRPSPVEDRHA